MPAAAELPIVPADILAALDAAPDAASRFAALPPSHKREYLNWIEDAKTPETRARRIAGTIDRLTAHRAPPG